MHTPSSGTAAGSQTKTPRQEENNWWIKITLKYRWKTDAEKHTVMTHVVLVGIVFD